MHINKMYDWCCFLFGDGGNMKCSSLRWMYCVWWYWCFVERVERACLNSYCFSFIKLSVFELLWAKLLIFCLFIIYAIRKYVIPWLTLILMIHAVIIHHYESVSNFLLFMHVSCWAYLHLYEWSWAWLRLVLVRYSMVIMLMEARLIGMIGVEPVLWRKDGSSCEASLSEWLSLNVVLFVCQTISILVVMVRKRCLELGNESIYSG